MTTKLFDIKYIILLIINSWYLSPSVFSVTQYTFAKLLITCCTSRDIGCIENKFVWFILLVLNNNFLYNDTTLLCSSFVIILVDFSKTCLIIYISFIILLNILSDIFSEPFIYSNSISYCLSTSWSLSIEGENVIIVKSKLILPNLISSNIIKLIRCLKRNVIFSVSVDNKLHNLVLIFSSIGSSSLNLNRISYWS